MSDYIFLVGDDYDCINKEYVILSTDKGQQITVALAASGVPFKGDLSRQCKLYYQTAEDQQDVRDFPACVQAVQLRRNGTKETTE